jgi:hypothetical protein
LNATFLNYPGIVTKMANITIITSTQAAAEVATSTFVPAMATTSGLGSQAHGTVCTKDEPTTPSFTTGIGIGIAASAGVVAITSLFWCMLALRRKRTEQDQLKPASTEERVVEMMSHLPVTELDQQNTRYELQTT